MTQLITETILRRAKFILAALIVFAVVNVTLLVAEVFILQRVQVSQDQLAATQAATARAAENAQVSAETTERVLSDTIEALAAGAPRAAATRAQVDYLCRLFGGPDCPPLPPDTTTTTRAGGG